MTINTYTNIGTGDQAYETGIEVVKGQNAELTPPVRGGYVLKGIKVVKGTETLGSENDLAVNGYANDKLTLTNLAENAKVYYYYKPISDAVDENQVTITVIEKYETFELGRTTYKETKLTADTTKLYAFGTYKGFKVTGYEIDGITQQLTENFTGASVDHKANHTITYIYGLADGSNNVVVPGKDNKLPSADDVTVKPTDPDKKPSVDGTGTVTVPEGGGTVETPNGKVDVPGGSKVDPDGTIKDPDGNPIKPDAPAETEKYYFVQYQANGGVGESYTQYIAKGTNATLKNVGELFSLRNFTENGWNTYANGNGVAYANGVTYTDGKSLTLYAQWTQSSTPTGKYSATILLKPNGAESGDVTQTIVSDDNNPLREKVQANPFHISGWTFAYWLNSSGGIVPDQEIVGVNNGDTLTLTAQWFSEKADGSITVPGENGKPGDTDDVTAKPNPNPGEGEDGSLKRDDKTGEITVPNGGSVIDKDGTEIAMPNGGTVKPDGTIVVKDPKGDITIKPDGSTEVIKPEGGKDDSQTTFTVTYQSGAAGKKDFVEYSTKTQDSAKKITVRNNIFTYDGYVFAYWTNAEDATVNVGVELDKDTILTAHWYKQVDGGVEIPGNNGNVVVKPAPDEIGKDGSVEVKPDATVKLPDGSEITLPEGSKVNPDGTITGPDGSKIDPENPEAAGYCYVVYLSGEGTGTMPKQFVKMNAQFTPRPNAFTAPTDKKFAGWKNQKNEDVAENATFLLTESTTLTAQWAPENELTPPSTDTDNKYQEDQVTGETLLILRGDWAGEASHTLKAYINGEAAAEGTVYWRLVVESYKDEFGFTNSSLNGSDIISLDATTGEILVKNSGIVRVECISTKDHTLKFSIVIIVPGDVNKDGSVDLMDASWVYDIYDKLSTVPAYDPENKFTLYQFELANLANVDKVLDLQDASAIIDLYDNVTSLKKTVS